MQYTKKELGEVLRQHKLWLYGNGGSIADLSRGRFIWGGFKGSKFA